jgi:hypothetical protein
LIVQKTDELFELKVDRLCLDLGRRVHHARITTSDGTPVLVSAMPCEPLESALPEKDLAIIKRYRRHVIAPGFEPAGYDEDGPDRFHVSPDTADRFTLLLAA